MGIKKAIGAAKTIARSLLEESDPEQIASDSEEVIKLLHEQVEMLNERLKNQERISLEYFEVIERIERERDQWKDMFFTQSSEHQNAQAILQKMLTDCSNHLRASLRQLNFFRSGAELEPVASPQMLETLPSDLPERYGEKMKELASGAKPQTDGTKERSKIAEKAKRLMG